MFEILDMTLSLAGMVYIYGNVRYGTCEIITLIVMVQFHVVTFVVKRLLVREQSFITIAGVVDLG